MNLLQKLDKLGGKDHIKAEIILGLIRQTEKEVEEAKMVVNRATEKKDELGGIYEVLAQRIALKSQGDKED